MYLCCYSPIHTNLNKPRKNVSVNLFFLEKRRHVTEWYFAQFISPLSFNAFHLKLGTENNGREPSDGNG